jgi:hypothetical protein
VISKIHPRITLDGVVIGGEYRDFSHPFANVEFVTEIVLEINKATRILTLVLVETSRDSNRADDVQRTTIWSGTGEDLSEILTAWNDPSVSIGDRPEQT